MLPQLWQGLGQKPPTLSLRVAVAYAMVRGIGGFSSLLKRWFHVSLFVFLP